MAAQAIRALKLAGRALAAILLALGIFVLAGWIGSSIPRNSDWVEPDDGVEIFVESNGVHTGLVLPLVAPQKDWRSDFPASDLDAKDPPYTHVSVSWGQREVFLNTPTWGDLTPSTVLSAAVGSDALLHVAHYVRPAPGPDFKPLVLRPEEYAALVAVIEPHVVATAERVTYRGYYAQDVFYETSGSYHIGNTCNQWTSDTLAAAGVKTGWWTPFAGGVMKWVEQP